MNICINQNDCIGCQLCADIAPEVFGADGEFAMPKGNIKNHNYNAIQEAIECCPVGAIRIIESSEVA